MARQIYSRVVIGSPTAAGAPFSNIDGYANAAVQQISVPVVLDNIRGLSFQVLFSGASSLNGTLLVQFTNLVTSNANGIIPQSYAGYPFNPVYPQSSLGWAIDSAVIGSPGFSNINGAISFIYEASPIDHRAMQWTWNPSSGTGNILVVVNAKSDSD